MRFNSQPVIRKVPGANQLAPKNRPGRSNSVYQLLKMAIWPAVSEQLLPKHDQQFVDPFSVNTSAGRNVFQSPLAIRTQPSLKVSEPDPSVLISTG